MHTERDSLTALVKQVTMTCDNDEIVNEYATWVLQCSQPFKTRFLAPLLDLDSTQIFDKQLVAHRLKVCRYDIVEWIANFWPGQPQPITPHTQIEVGELDQFWNGLLLQFLQIIDSETKERLDRFLFSDLYSPLIPLQLQNLVTGKIVEFFVEFARGVGEISGHTASKKLQAFEGYYHALADTAVLSFLKKPDVKSYCNEKGFHCATQLQVHQYSERPDMVFFANGTYWIVEFKGPQSTDSDATKCLKQLLGYRTIMMAYFDQQHQLNKTLFPGYVNINLLCLQFKTKSEYKSGGQPICVLHHWLYKTTPNFVVPQQTINIQ